MKLGEVVRSNIDLSAISREAKGTQKFRDWLSRTRAEKRKAQDKRDLALFERGEIRADGALIKPCRVPVRLPDLDLRRK